MLFLLPLVLVACESTDTYPRGSGWMHYNGTGMMGYGWGGIFMWLLLIVVGIILVSAVLKGSNNTSEKNDTPIEILKKRYARGEISKEEFERMKKDLM